MNDAVELSHRDKTIIIAGLMTGLLLAALDQGVESLFLVPAQGVVRMGDEMRRVALPDMPSWPAAVAPIHFPTKAASHSGARAGSW